MFLNYNSTFFLVVFESRYAIKTLFYLRKQFLLLHIPFHLFFFKYKTNLKLQCLLTDIIISLFVLLLFFFSYFCFWAIPSDVHGYRNDSGSFQGHMRYRGSGQDSCKLGKHLYPILYFCPSSRRFLSLMLSYLSSYVL